MNSGRLQNTKSIYKKKSIIFLHICNEKSENEIKKTIQKKQTKNSIKNNKILRSKFNKRSAKFIGGNHETLLKAIKDLNRF